VIKSLYIAHGLALPSTTGPWSEAELLLMLGRLEGVSLSAAEQSAYDFAAGELNRDKGIFKFSFIPTIEIHAHTNTEDFVTPDQYIRPVSSMKPLLVFNTEAWFTDYFYALGSFNLGNKVYNTMVNSPYSEGTQYVGSTLFGESAFSTNIWMVSPSTGPRDFDWSFPQRALLSIGGSFWNDKVKYLFNISSFQYPEYFTSEGWNPNVSVPSETHGYNLFIAHRFEYRPIRQLNFVLTEAVMDQVNTDEGETISPMSFLPMMVLHNISRPNELNTLITLEADYTVIPGLNIYAQVAMDEFQIPGVDAASSADTKTNPNTFGYMLGLQTAFPLGGRLFSASLEAAYTDPFLYLRGKSQGEQSKGEAGLNYVVANRQAVSPYLYYEEFLGYRWGGDAIVVNGHAGYREPGHWNAEANLLFMVHGTYDKWTTYRHVYSADHVAASGSQDVSGNTTPTTSHPQDNQADDNASKRDAASYTTALSLLGSWNLPWVRGLSVYGQADLVCVVNPGNRSENPPAWDLQMTMGVSYAF
jgi:hypothetical protein